MFLCILDFVNDAADTEIYTYWRTLSLPVTLPFSLVQRARSLADGWRTEQAPQFALWLPVSLGLGVALWFVLPSPGLWIAALGAFGAIAAGGSALGGRVGRLALWFGLVAAIGLALVWMRAERVAAPRLEDRKSTRLNSRH